MESDLLDSNSVSRVGFSDNPDSYQAGVDAVLRACADDDSAKAWQLAILISTSRHNPERLRQGVQSILSANCTLIGGYGVGVITNNKLGYDGYQVGILLIKYSNDSSIDVVVAKGLANNEFAIGREIGAAIRDKQYQGEPSVILLYDSINRLKGRFEMNMATYLLQGMKSEIPVWPRLVGAGLVGDMQCRETYQWYGDQILQQSAIALVLSGNMRIDSTVMHGCKPASSYHTITETDGNTVLKIDHTPALDKIAELLGAQSGKSWRDYSFFVTLGVNRGDKFGRYDEDVYANRLCMGVDLERKGLVMFEPDLKAGMDVQLMRREMDFSYIKSKVENLLGQLGGRKPVFALYIDCAGRAAAYSGFDAEEAEEVQRCLGNIPLLGIYSGVEIGEVSGEPTALDWTGVLAIASEGAVTQGEDATREKMEDLSGFKESHTDAYLDLYHELNENEKLKLIDDANNRIHELGRSSSYYAQLTDELAGLNVKYDATLTARNNELRIKKQGFSVLANLQSRAYSNQTLDTLCHSTIHEINATLKMDKTIVLMRGNEVYKPEFWKGFSEDKIAQFSSCQFEHDSTWMNDGFILVNRSSVKSQIVKSIKDKLDLPFFIAVPIKEEGRTIGLLISGRVKEVNPFYPALEMGDVDTFKAISGFLSSTQQLNRQRSELENMNRTLEQKVRDRTAELREALKQLEQKNRFIKKIFGRYMSNEVVEQILEAPEGLELGGKSLSVTVMFTDLRGFSAISETLPPESVVEMLNIYLKEMTEIVFSYSGTINEFMGDGILILFGAPTTHANDAERAIACAIAMQLAMTKVNKINAMHGYPELAMGIGIHTGKVIAGNIGSNMRTKYAVIGSNVNLTARVESYTVGGQILVTKETFKSVDCELKVNNKFTAPFKGISEPVTMLDIGGIYGSHNLFLSEVIVNYKYLDQPLRIRFEELQGKLSSDAFADGDIIALSHGYGIISTSADLEVRSNIKVFLASHLEAENAVYAKVIMRQKHGFYEVNFTYIPKRLADILSHEDSNMQHSVWCDNTAGYDD